MTSFGRCYDVKTFSDVVGTSYLGLGI